MHPNQLLCFRRWNEYSSSKVCECSGNPNLFFDSLVKHEGRRGGSGRRKKQYEEKHTHSRQTRRPTLQVQFCYVSRRDFSTHERDKFSFKHVMEHDINVRVPPKGHNFVSQICYACKFKSPVGMWTMCPFSHTTSDGVATHQLLFLEKEEEERQK